MTISITSWFGIALIGVVAGVLSGSLGVGSGIFVIPALVLFLGCAQKSAQGMALALMVPMALLGAIQYARTPGVQLQWELILILIAGALVGVLLGTRLMAKIPDILIQRFFAVFLLIVAVRMLWPAKPSQVRTSSKNLIAQAPTTPEKR